MDVNLAFRDYILSPSVLLVIILMSACQFAFLIVVIVMLTFTVLPVFEQSILIAL